jgi:hypothetical protein
MQPIQEVGAFVPRKANVRSSTPSGVSLSSWRRSEFAGIENPLKNGPFSPLMLVLSAKQTFHRRLSALANGFVSPVLDILNRINDALREKHSEEKA